MIEKHLLSGMIQHEVDGTRSTHNPSVLGSSPSRPTIIITIISPTII